MLKKSAASESGAGAELPADGRRRRGVRRRAELVAATLEVIERGGVGSVSHRSVAKLAGVSPPAAIHYFATLDDLLIASLISANEEAMETIEAAESVESLAELLVDLVDQHRARFVAIYELYLLAARRPALQGEAYRWIRCVEDTARRLGADETGTRTLVAALDGLGLEALLMDTPPERDRIVAVLNRAIGR